MVTFRVEELERVCFGGKNSISRQSPTGIIPAPLFTINHRGHRARASSTHTIPQNIRICEYLFQGDTCWVLNPRWHPGPPFSPLDNILQLRHQCIDIPLVVVNMQ